MPKKYRFKKCYVICEDNMIFGNIQQVPIFRDKDYALEICNREQRKAIEDANMQFNKGKPIPVHTAHGFYLVHESLFDEILKLHSK